MNINYNDLLSLKRLYNKAKKEGKDIFVFKGSDLLVSYAKYLIEYLETKFDKSSLN